MLKLKGVGWETALQECPAYCGVGGVWCRFGGLGRWQLQVVASEDVLAVRRFGAVGAKFDRMGMDPLNDATCSGGGLN